MGMWEILEEGRDDYGRGFGMRGDEVEEAYKEGCRHGYEKAMREIHGDMGFRDGGRNYSGSGMGERRYIIRKSKFPQNPKRSVRFSGKRTKRSVQKRKARNTQKAETKVL